MNRRAPFTPLLPLLVAIPAAAQLGGGVFTCPTCASESTSAATYARQAVQLLKEAETATQAIQMAQMMVREGVNLAQHPTTNIAADLGTLQAILSQSTQLAGSMAQMNTAFNSTYHAYDPTGVNNFAQAYNSWAQNTLKTLSGAVNAAGYQGQMLQSEAAWTGDQSPEPDAAGTRSGAPARQHDRDTGGRAASGIAAIDAHRHEREERVHG